MLTDRVLLFVVNTNSFFLSHRLPLAEAALEKGWKVHVAAKLENDNAIRIPGVILHDLSLNRSSQNPFSLILSFVQIFFLLVRLRPDVVHFVTVKPIILGGLAARLVRTKGVIYAVSGLGYLFLADGWWANIRRKLVALCYRIILGHKNATVIVQNPEDAEQIKTFNKNVEHQIRLIAGSGVDLDKFCSFGLPSTKITSCFVGRLLFDKGITEFVDAAKKVKECRPNVRFIVVGSLDKDNPSRVEKGIVEDWVRQGIVEWWGHQEDMVSVYRSAHLVVLPSYREGFPKVLIEAAACGRGVVTTDVPGCRDAIEQNVTGLLVPPRDPDALADAVLNLIDDPVRMRTLGVEARKYAEEKFSIDFVRDAHLEIYEKLMASSK